METRDLLIGLTENNINEFYQDRFIKFRYYSSHEVSIGGKHINRGFDRFLELCPKIKNDKENRIKVFISDATKDGFLLTEKTFIRKELLRLKKDFPEDKWSNIDLEEKVQFYSDFLMKKLEYIKDKSNQINSQKEREKVEHYSEQQLDILFSGLKDCFTPYNKEYFIYALTGGRKPEGYDGLMLKKPFTDNLMVYLIDSLFEDWEVLKEFNIKNPDQKKTNYKSNKEGKPKGYDKIEAMLTKLNEVSR